MDLPIDFLFSILRAPTQQGILYQHREGAIRRGVRRLSNLVQAATKPLFSTPKSAAIAKEIDVETLHARKDLCLENNLFNEWLTQRSAVRSSLRATLLQGSDRETIDESQSTLWTDIWLQAKSLFPKSLKQEFLISWGLSSTDDLGHSRLDSIHWQQALLLEQEFVSTTAKTRLSRLAHATEAHVGVEILHTFILDLLGGTHTAAGQIMGQKLKADFRETAVVSFWMKAFAGLMLIAINIGCLLFAVLRANDRGLSWQRQYLFAALLQLAVEVIVFETVVVLWSQVYVPHLIFDDVHHAHGVLTEILENLASRSKDGVLSMEHESQILNAPDYLFVSVPLAQQYPALIESQIVLSYQTFCPPKSIEQLLRRFKQESTPSTSSTNWWSTFAFSASIMFLVAVIPMEVQSFALNLLQPIVLTALSVVVYACLRHPHFFAVFAIPLLVLLGLLYWRIDFLSRRQQRLFVSDRMKREDISRKVFPVRPTEVSAPVVEAEHSRNVESVSSESSHDFIVNIDMQNDFSELEFRVNQISENRASSASSICSSIKYNAAIEEWSSLGEDGVSTQNI